MCGSCAVNLDIHESVTSGGTGRVGWTDFSDFEHHTRGDAIVTPEQYTGILYAVPGSVSVTSDGAKKASAEQ